MKSSVKSVRIVRKTLLHFVQCAQYLCAGCERAHKRLKGTTFHEVFSVDKALKGKMKVSAVHCAKHPQQEINVYCHQDKQAICFECIIDSHPTHQVERVVDVGKEFKEDVSQGLFFFVLSFFFPKSDHPLIIL